MPAVHCDVVRFGKARRWKKQVGAVRWSMIRDDEPSMRGEDEFEASSCPHGQWVVKQSCKQYLLKEQANWRARAEWAC